LMFQNVSVGTGIGSANDKHRARLTQDERAPVPSPSWADAPTLLIEGFEQQKRHSQFPAKLT
jgi:hypothetical protein